MGIVCFLGENRYFGELNTTLKPTLQYNNDNFISEPPQDVTTNDPPKQVNFSENTNILQLVHILREIRKEYLFSER